MNLFDYNPEHFLSFLLTFMRISIVLFMLPVYAVTGLPNQWKAAFCLIIALAIWPHVALSPHTMPSHPFEIALLLLGEIILALVLALSVRIFFAGIQAGGELIAMQMGFSMLQFADPTTDSQTGIIAQLLYLTSTLMFLGFDGHLYLLRAFIKTFDYIPPGGIFIGQSIFDQIFLLANMLFTLAIKVIAPVLAAIFFVELGLGLMSRMAPQMHILEFGFPLKISVGFFFLTTIFAALSIDIERFVADLDELFLNLVRAGLQP